MVYTSPDQWFSHFTEYTAIKLGKLVKCIFPDLIPQNSDLVSLRWE